MKNKEAVFLARKMIKEVIYNISLFENINATFPETETILDGGKVFNVDEHDITVIINLKRAWNSIINKHNSLIELEEIKKINKIIGQNLVLFEGELRQSDAFVGGVKETIKPPKINEVNNKLLEINAMTDPLEKTLEWLTYGITSQLFNDGNKRTSFLIANEILIAENIGVIYIQEDKLLDFHMNLNNYYNNKNYENKNNLKDCLKDNIINTEWYKNKINDRER